MMDLNLHAGVSKLSLHPPCEHGPASEGDWTVFSKLNTQAQLHLS